MRVVILTSGPYGTASRCLPELVASGRIEVVSVIMAEESPATFKTRKRKLRKTMKIGVMGALNSIRMRPWYEGDPTEHIETLCARFNIPLHRTAELNGERTAELFRVAKADLGLSLGNRYISKRIYSIPRLGMINVHGERLPEYRNAHGVIWNVYNMDRITGLTVHEIDDRIDTGRIFYREELPIEFHASLKETVTRTMRRVYNRMAFAVRYVCENYDELSRLAKPQPNGRSYTTPTFGEFLTMVRNNRKLYEAAGVSHAA